MSMGASIQSTMAGWGKKYGWTLDETARNLYEIYGDLGWDLCWDTPEDCAFEQEQELELAEARKIINFIWRKAKEQK